MPVLFKSATPSSVHPQSAKYILNLRQLSPLVILPVLIFVKTTLFPDKSNKKRKNDIAIMKYFLLIRERFFPADVVVAPQLPQHFCITKER